MKSPVGRRLITLIILGAVLVAGCTPAGPGPTAGDPTSVAPTTVAPGAVTGSPDGDGGTLVVARAGDIDLLDPHLATAYSSTETLDLIYETLFELDQELSPVPGLAESHEYSDDGLTLTLNLVEGVTFHSGDAFDSGDVVASLERILDEATGAVTRSNLLTIEDISAPDPATVVLELSEADATLPSALADLNTAIASGDDITSGAVANEPNGTGPFSFVEWNQGESVTLAANSDYWREGPFVDEVQFQAVADEASILAGLRADRFHIGLLTDPALATEVGEDLVVERVPTLTFHAILLNGTREPFDDVRVRQALACALDRQEVIDTALLGEGEVTGPFPGPAFRDNLYDGLPCEPPDLEVARQLLSEAGYPDGFSFTAIVPTGQQATALAEAQSEQAQLAEIGVTMDIEPLEINVFVDRWLAVDFDAAPSVISGGPDPHHLYARYFMSTGNLNNVATYSSEELDQMFIEALRETDPEPRTEIYRDISRHLLEASPWMWLFSTYEYTVLAPTVTGFEAKPISAGSLESLRMVKLQASE